MSIEARGTDHMKTRYGETFDDWTVIGNYATTSTGERKWLCRCRCGTERYVLERSLLYGGSKSCGCQRKEKATAAVAHNLSGQAFGDLVALRIAEKERKSNGIWWHCLCSCGNECDVLATLLVTGKKNKLWLQIPKELCNSRYCRDAVSKLDCLISDR